MALSTSPPEASATGEAESEPARAGGQEDPRAAWWRQRSWRKDVEVLARVRQGLATLQAAEDPGAPQGPADPPSTMPQTRPPTPASGPASPPQRVRLEPAQPETTQFQTTQPATTLFEPAQPRPAQPRPAQPRPAQPRPARPEPPRPEPPRPEPIQQGPAQQRPVQHRPVQHRPVQHRPAWPGLVQRGPARPQQVEPEPTQAQPSSLQAEPQTVPQTVSQAVPQTVSQAVPQTVPPAVSSAVSQTVPLAVSPATSQALPQADPPAVSQSVPQADPPASAPQTQPAGPPVDPAIVAIRETFAAVAAAGDDAAAFFYASMFARRPRLRDLFAPAMDEQRDRLFHALARIVDSLSTPEEMANYLIQLGRDHRKYSVEPEMYDVVGESLIATLRRFAGHAFTPGAESAWRQTYAAAAALMIRAAEEDSQTSPAFWTAEVVANDQRRPGISVITIAPDQPLEYEAGQHVTVQTPRWPRVWRPYSIACRPRDDGLVSFHVKAVPGGWVSNALVRHTAPGSELIVGPALGTMTLRHAGTRDILCVAGGTGLSPVKAIIEQVVRDAAAGQQRRVNLFYGARTREELYDLHDLWRLADAYSGFQLMPVTSDDPAFDGMQGNVGRVAARYLPHADCEAYVAGPADMVRETTRLLARAGLSRERIHYDNALLDSRPRGNTST
ncbi:MAG TPA: globin domain-containing protein [Streptosporangiaceae bacterium]|nr:globin domain-containing protein [Streptosporangiaceae bacterium]